MTENIDQPVNEQIIDDSTGTEDIDLQEESGQVVASPQLEEKAGHFHVNNWNGLPNYGCPFCLFATLDGDDLVADHIVERHGDRGEEAEQALEQYFASKET